VTVGAGDLSLTNAGEISSSAFGTGNAGAVTVSVGSLSLNSGGQIASTTAGLGNGGNMDVMIADAATLSGTGSNGASGVTASAVQASADQAGNIVLAVGGMLSLSGGAQIASTTAGSGSGGTVEVRDGGPLTLG
jgi:hypothetical protein